MRVRVRFRLRVRVRVGVKRTNGEHVDEAREGVGVAEAKVHDGRARSDDERDDATVVDVPQRDLPLLVRRAEEMVHRRAP